MEVQCKGCDDFCIGETASPFGMRFKEHVAITINKGGWGSAKVVRPPDLRYVLLFNPHRGGGHVQKKS